MNNSIEVLDHGYVKLLNVSGPTRRADCKFDADDVDPANAARMSFGAMNSNRTREQDLKLCDYLMKHKHSTPIEQIVVWLEMKLPILVARHFLRHRTLSVDEISARYVTLPEEWYIPDTVGGKAKDRKQGQEDNLSDADQKEFKNDLEINCANSYGLYLYHIKKGVAPEHARMFLHLNHYTKLVWRQDLHNMLHFLRLRMASDAQIEDREYAKAIFALLEKVLPFLMKNGL